MKTSVNRRDFLARSAAVAGVFCVGGHLQAAPRKTVLRKALIGKPTGETFASWKAAGFQGMETTVWDASPAEAAAAVLANSAQVLKGPCSAPHIRGTLNATINRARLGSNNLNSRTGAAAPSPPGSFRRKSRPRTTTFAVLVIETDTAIPR